MRIWYTYQPILDHISSGPTSRSPPVAPCGRDGRGRELPVHGVGPVDDPVSDGDAAVLLLRRPRLLDIRVGRPDGRVPEVTRPGTGLKLNLNMEIEDLFKQRPGGAD